jgi:hypothetical protein
MPLSPDEKQLRWKAYYAANSARLKAYARARYERIKDSPEFIEKRRGWSRRTNRISRGIADAPQEARHGECVICGNVRALVCDHDHETGEVRGWPCRHCNMFLGRTKADAIARAQRVLKYVGAL